MSNNVNKMLKTVMEDFVLAEKLDIYTDIYLYSDRLNDIIDIAGVFQPKKLNKLLSFSLKNNLFPTTVKLINKHNIPTIKLKELSEHECSDIRAAVALKQNTPNDVLIKLMKDKYPEVRSNVALNDNLKSEYLIEMSNDEYYRVRANVASNINTPLHIVKRLANDESPTVRGHVLQNKNLRNNSDEFNQVLKMYKDEKHPYVRKIISTDNLINDSELPSLITDKYGIIKEQSTPRYICFDNKYDLFYIESWMD